MDVVQMNLPTLKIGCALMLCLTLLSANTLAAKPTSAAQISVEDFVKLPQGKNVKISPDGIHLSVVFKQKNQYVLAILDAVTRQSIGTYQVKGEGKGVGKVYWVNNERLIYSVTQSYSWNKKVFNNGELIGINIDGSKHQVVFGYRSHRNHGNKSRHKLFGENGSNDILDLLPNDDKHILLAFYPWRNKGNRWVTNQSVRPTVFKLNIYNGIPEKVDTLPMPLADAIVDNDANVRFAIGKDDDNNQVIWYKDKLDDKWQRWSLKDFEGNELTPVSFTPDNTQVYLMANVGQGTRALYSLNLKDKSTQKLVHDETVDISSLIYDFSGRQIIAVGTDMALPVYSYIAGKNIKSELHKTLLGNFKGYDVVITSSTRDTEKVIVKVYSDTHPGAYFLYHRKSKKFEFVIARRPWINHELTSITEALSVKTRDGSTIYGYLTQPKNAEKDKKLPMVVLPHGGPHGTRDYWGFDWEVQLLASRGYAVLQVNFRGSDGFGLDYENSGKGKWGTLMQDDLTDATKAMIAQGIADPARICLFGSSFGGYAALMGVVRQPDLYRCAIGSAGIYNLPMMYEEGDIQERDSGLAYLREVLGEDEVDLKRRSPAFNVDRIKAQVLLIHGAKDKRAPIEQAESLMEAFDKIGKKYQWMEIDNESHGYYDEINRLKVYRRVLYFLEENIGASR
jgi:dipeptidyl aminopeptidase/acylaminoacyl peptidase